VMNLIPFKMGKVVLTGNAFVTMASLLINACRFILMFTIRDLLSLPERCGCYLNTGEWLADHSFIETAF